MPEKFITLDHRELVTRMMAAAFDVPREIAERHVEKEDMAAKGFGRAAKAAMEYFTECVNQTMPARLERVPRSKVQ